MFETPYRATFDDGVLEVSGSVDEYGVAALRSDLEAHTEGHTRSLTVVLSGLDYLPSIAVSVLTRAMGRCRRAGADLRLVAASGSVAQRILMISALPYTED